MIPAEKLVIVKKVRSYMDKQVAPIINKYWVDAAQARKQVNVATM